MTGGIGIGEHGFPPVQPGLQFRRAVPEGRLLRDELGRGHGAAVEGRGEAVDLPEVRGDVDRDVQQSVEDVLGWSVARPRDGQPLLAREERGFALDERRGNLSQ